MSAYSDDQSEDGELARSPPPLHQDFSLSEDEPDTGDSLDIKPPQAKLRADRVKDERRSRHSKPERRKEHTRSHKKHLDREQLELRSRREPEITKHSDRELFHNKEYYKERENVREKEVYREKEPYRGRDHYRDKDYKEKEIYREGDPYREKEVYREKESYRIKEPYREKDHHKEKDSFRDKEFYKESYREKDPYREKEMVREKELYLMREKERVSRHGEGDRSKSHRHVEADRKAMSREDSRLRHGDDSNRLKDSNLRYVEKENREKQTGDKELEDLRSRLLSKRQTKEQQQVSRKQRDDKSDGSLEREMTHSSRLPELDKSQLERREKLLKTVVLAEREMSHRKKTSRAALAARRERLKEDGAKRSCPSSPSQHKKRRRHSRPASPSPLTPLDDVVMVSDASDLEVKSDISQHSNNTEEGTATSSESSTGTSAEETETEEEEEEEEEEDNNTEKKDDDSHKSKPITLRDEEKDEEGRRSTDPPSIHRLEASPASIHSATPKHRSRSRSRSNSFSPPPIDENGAADELLMEEPSSPVAKTPEEKIDLPPYYPALQGCRSVEEFQCLNRIEEGTFGVVYRARDKTTDEIVALKRLKMEKEKEGFPITSLREINTLLKGQHPNIVTVREIVVGSNMDKIFIVMDYVEHDLKGLMETMRSRKQVFLPGEVKCLMQQLLLAVDHLHDNWILHRDLKTSNLLLSHKGILKVGDFGLAREYGSPLKSYTPIVVTLWYRAPELLLGARQYSTPIDIWSVGCIFAEFLTMNALFPGKSEVDQLNRIFKELGTPNESVWPGWSSLSGARATWADQPGGGLRTRMGSTLSETGLTLLNALLTYDPQQRSTARQALCDNYFKEQPLAIDPAMFPTWPAKSESGRRHQHSPKPPSGGDQYKLLKEDDQAAFGFHMGQPAPAMATYLPPSSGFKLKF
ncbi:cyclin dependent kinase 11B pitslre isoform X2 [Arctopsyche grandis]|uniref:cyclin dependent kinase 11B pitslre isoform X2 n=1 Tax=Arctopsyche grandis TaxID=121162 RepID=UPI00406DA45D